VPEREKEFEAYDSHGKTRVGVLRRVERCVGRWVSDSSQYARASIQRAAAVCEFFFQK
jgi:hypothetical protein